MKTRRLLLLVVAISAPPAFAQQADPPGLGEVVVTGNRFNTRYAQQDRPVIGLRRQADAAVLPVSISSDTREEGARKKEIQAVLLSALERATGAGIEILSGTVQLIPVTKANYQELSFQYAGRVDTSRVDIMLKVKLYGSAAAAEKKLTDFIKATSSYGRASMDKTGGLTLTIVNPDQYRDAILKLVAEDARHNAGIFGPDFAFNISGIDGQVAWSQVSSTDVFLYLPYKYVIVPK
ncbi:MAG: TonB-dependent receptor [Sphingobium sp.]|nr:TonB-dependent receptor [Sphingobium sp.]MBP9158679.1 TonB-dependent receptor [Sphingobium sp.]